MIQGLILLVIGYAAWLLFTNDDDPQQVQRLAEHDWNFPQGACSDAGAKRIGRGTTHTGIRNRHPML